jgi:hypothetical protein
MSPPDREPSARRRFSAPANSTREARLVCGVSAGHWRFSAIAHSISSIIGLLSISSLLLQVPRPVVFNALGVALAA